ncbi:MAG: oligosaccharide flippase family protein [Candidatus Methanomethyliales bacterium]|nr:oligosaccharide flippase family protein [Candidatus Methanomethylicales archaeon]
MNDEKVRLARSAAYIAAQTVVSIITGIVYFAFAARLLPTIADLGKVSAITMFSSLLLTVLIFALPSAISKYYSEFLGKGISSDAISVAYTGFKIGTILAVFGGGFCLLFAPALSLIFFGSEAEAIFFRMLALDILALFFSQFSFSLLYGSQRFKELSITSILSNLVRAVAAISFLLLGLGIAGIILGWIIADFLFLFLSLLFCRDIIRKMRGAFPLFTLLKYSAPIYGSNILGYLQSTIDRYIVLGLAGAHTLGIYSPATTAVLYVSSLSGSLASAIFPRVSGLFGKGDIHGILRTTKVASRYSAIIYSPLALGLAATALPTVDLFAGSRYIEGSPALAIMAVASVVLSLHYIVYTYIASIGKTFVFFISQAVAIIACTFVSIFFVPQLGAVGAAIGRSALILANFFTMLLYVKSEIRDLIDWKCFFTSLIISSIMSIFVSIFVRAYYSKYLMPAYIVIGGIVYIIMLKTLKIVNNADLELLIALFPQRLRGLATKFGHFLVS